MSNRSVSIRLYGTERGLVAESGDRPMPLTFETFVAILGLRIKRIRQRIRARG